MGYGWGMRTGKRKTMGVGIKLKRMCLSRCYISGKTHSKKMPHDKLTSKSSERLKSLTKKCGEEAINLVSLIMSYPFL